MHDPVRSVARQVWRNANPDNGLDRGLDRGRLGEGSRLIPEETAIADKVLTGSALVGLSVLGALSWWVTGVIAVREIGVTLLRFWVIRHGVIPASRGGKAKTLVQVIAIALYLLPLPAWAALVRWPAMGAALVLTVLTGLDYVVQAMRLRARGRRQPASAPEHL